MAKRNHPWADKWEEVRALGKGGQGRTILVRRRDAPDEPFRVLKVLSRQDDSERRARMHREIAALETIDHPRVPKLIESNGEAFRDSSVPMYLIMEHVDGSSLDKHIDESGPLPLHSASELTLGLLNALVACHRAGLVHRDIKPDNIIISTTGEAHLVDWGLSFSLADTGSLETGSMELGNRFLHLPELQEGEQKREQISDLTQVVGILFYALTSRTPRVLVDGQGRKPHQREEAAKALSSIDDGYRLKLLRLFDRAFDARTERRFATTESLVSAINGLTTSDTGRHATDEARLLLNIKNQLTGSHHYSDSVDFASAFDSVQRALNEVFHDIARYALEELVLHEPWYDTVELYATPAQLRSGWNLNRKLDRVALIQYRFEAVISGTEIVLSGTVYDAQEDKNLEETTEDICRIAINTLPGGERERHKAIRLIIIPPCRSYVLRYFEKYGRFSA